MKHKVIQKIKQFLLHRSLISSSSDPGSGNRLRCSRSTYIKNQRNIRVIGSVSLVLLLTLTAFTLRPVSVSTDFAEATANPATTTLTVETTGNAAILDITPSSTTGTFSSSDTSGTSLEFSVTTDNITGYNLGISHASATTPTPLTSEDLSENLDSLPTGTSITESQFNSNEYVGHYGYRPSMLNSEDNSNYIPAPTTTPTPINVTQCANNTTNCNTASDEYTIAIGANIDYTKSAGTYTNTFILTAVANNVAYTINYKDNTGDTSIGNSLPETESASVTGASFFTLSSAKPTRTGYTFDKWCDGNVAHVDSGNSTCDGNTYEAGDTYSFSSPSATSTNVANLYAMWKADTHSLAITFATNTGVSSVNVCKTAGDCSGDNLMGTVSSSGSSVSGLTYGVPYYLYPTYSTGYTLSSWAKTDSATNSSLSSTSDPNPTYKIGDGNGAVTITGKTQSYTCTKRYRLQNADGTYPSSYTVDGTSSIAYGSTCSYAKSASYYTTQSTSCTMGTSGCTLSLDLPRTTYTLTVNRNTSYISSVSGAGTYRWGQAVSISATPATGSSFNGWTVSSGSTGSFGSSSSASTTYTMPQGNSTIYADGKTSKLYIQDFTNEMCSTQASSSEVTVYDKRDEKSYTVRYINGNCWMTQNLRFSGSYIEPTNTNIDTARTISWGDLYNGSSDDYYALYHDSGDAIYGYWYNYAGASGMTITGGYYYSDASYSICPQGWKLPTLNQFSGIAGNFAFNPVIGGYYSYGSLYNTWYGFWWSATAYDYNVRYLLYWDGYSVLDTNYYYNPYDGYTYNGFYVRCIRSS